MDETVRLRMRRAHARYEFYCSCGKIVHGNGGKANHFYVDGQRNQPREGHRRLTSAQWHEQYRTCTTCRGLCLWAEDAWVCGSCGDEWYPDHDPRYYAAPGEKS